MSSPDEAIVLLTELTRELQRSRTFNDLLQLVVDQAARLLGSEGVSLRLLDPSGTELLARCRSGNPLHTDPSEPFEVGEGLIGWIVEQRSALRSGAADDDPRYAPRPHMKARLRSFVGVPLVAGDSVLGVLSAPSPEPDRFSLVDEQRLTLLAGIAAPHIEIARRDFVVRDPLTGLFNHAYFQQIIGREVERSLVYGLPFSLLLVGVDNFRRVNDTHGTAQGDALLEALSEVLEGRGPRDDEVFRLRGQDAVARFAGDEFAVVLPHTPKASGMKKAEQLRQYVAGCSFSRLELSKQTVSVGIAAVPDDAYDRSGLVSAAERALRAAKRQGRNQCVAHSRALAVAQAVESSQEVDLSKFMALETTIDEADVVYAYQPIVETRGRTIVGYEALCRPSNSVFAGPADLFEIAEAAGRVVELGRVCRTVSMAAMSELPDGRLLFLNLHPLELDEVALMAEEALKPWAGRLVLEITETSAIEDYERVRGVLDRLREYGCRIALDDLGAGYAGLNSLAQLQPDYVKLDMALVRRINVKSATRRLVKLILEFCGGEQIPVISEGVETEAELAEVTALGCPLVQGSLLASPSPAFVELADVV